MVAFDHVHGAAQLFWGDLIEKGGRISEDEALQQATDAGVSDPHDAITRLRGIDYIEFVSGEIRITRKRAAPTSGMPMTMPSGWATER